MLVVDVILYGAALNVFVNGLRLASHESFISVI